MRATIKAYSATVLPFPSIIIPLSVFFATKNDQDTYPTGEQQEKLESWIWRSFFSRRYSKRLEQLNLDIKEISKIKDNVDNKLGEFSVDIDESFFRNTAFSINTVNTKTFILMLASENPLNFISGSPVSLEPVLRNCNKKEFHHVYPRKYLIERGYSNRDLNCIANFVLLSKADNNKLGGNAPSIYRKVMRSNDEAVRLILKRSLCPLDIFHDDYTRFLDARTIILLDKAKQLMRID